MCVRLFSFSIFDFRISKKVFEKTPYTYPTVLGKYYHERVTERNPPSLSVKDTKNIRKRSHCR